MIWGKCGYQGQRGRIGPPGPPGPTIKIPFPQWPTAPAAKPLESNITLNSTGMEESFKGLSDSLNQIFAKQATLNQTLQGHVTLGIQAQDEQAQALQLLAASSQQRDYDRLFNAIPMYNGEDPMACKAWLEKLETACRTGRRDIRDIAITCAEGPVLEVINSVKEDEDWPVLKDEIRRCFSENKTPVHAAALLDEFPSQGANQNLRAFLYKYTKLHKIATGVQARHDYDLRQKLHFLKHLRNTRIANKIGRSAEFKDYNNFSLAMCFGRALEMEGEFQVGEKCVPSEDPSVLAVQVGQMSDAEICNLTKTTTPPTQTPTPMPRKFNPNSCFQCRLLGHKVVDCPFNQKDKVPEIGGKIHHFLETQTPVDKDLWAEFFNKCIKAQTAKKFHRFRKKFQEAVTAAQTTTAVAATQAVLASTTTGAKVPKRVTFAKPAETETKLKTPDSGPLTSPSGGITQPTPKKKPVKVKKEIDEVDSSPSIQMPKLTEEEETILATLENSGYFQPSETEGETEPETLEPSESESE